MDLDVRIQDLTLTGKTICTKALLDSDCTSSIIDSKFVELHLLSKHPLAKAILAINADGSKNLSGSVTHITLLSLTISDYMEKIMFTITFLGDHNII